MNAQHHIEVTSPHHLVRPQQAALSLNGAATTAHSGRKLWQTATISTYLRSKPELPPEAITDLEEYFTHLRNYYDIPDSHPVFPPVPEKYKAKRVPKELRIATGKNRNDHPWRTS